MWLGLGIGQVWVVWVNKKKVIWILFKRKIRETKFHEKIKNHQ
jgi:hypothetical protein